MINGQYNADYEHKHFLSGSLTHNLKDQIDEICSSPWGWRFQQPENSTQCTILDQVVELEVQVVLCFESLHDLSQVVLELDL